MRVLTKSSSLFSLFRQALRGDHQNFTEGSIDKAIFLLSVPMVLEMLMESTFAVVDIFFVSQLGDNDAVATIGLTESVLTVVYSIAFGMSMAATAVVARRIGEKDVHGATVSAVQAIYIGVGISILVSVFGLTFAEEILTLLGGSEGVISRGTSYARWMFGGNISIMMLFLINAIFRGAGNASLAMRSLWLANGLNIILDPILILGLGPLPSLGVEGAAIATNIGRGCGVLFQVYHLVKGTGTIRFRSGIYKLRLDIVGRLLKIASGGTGQFLIASASWIFLIRIVSTFGSAALAGYTIAIRIIIFAILPAWGMANAAATLVGQNLGAGLPQRAEKSVWRAAFITMIFLGMITVIFLLTARPVVEFFTTDAEVLRYAVRCLQIVCLGYIFYAYGMVISQAFNGAGDTRTPTILNFFGFWLLQIPLAYAMAVMMGLGPTGTFIAISLAESILAVAAILVFRRGKWKTVQV